MVQLSAWMRRYDVVAEEWEQLVVRESDFYRSSGDDHVDGFCRPRPSAVGLIVADDMST